MVKKVEIFQIKITLKGSKPPIWRRVLVRANMNFHELHLVIQAAMGWENYHLYQFDTKQNLELVADNEDLMNDVFGFRTERKLAKRVKLSDVFVEEKQKITYWYDFGDDWMHDVTLEKIIDVEKGVKYPTCTAGKRACPPEDCGGVWGYENLLDLQKNPPKKGSDEYEWYEEQKECLEELDSEEFDLEEAKEMVQNYKEMEVELFEMNDALESFSSGDFEMMSEDKVISDLNNAMLELIKIDGEFMESKKIVMKSLMLTIAIGSKLGIEVEKWEDIFESYQMLFKQSILEHELKENDIFIEEVMKKISFNLK